MWRSDEGAVQVRAADVTLVTAHTSPHTRTYVSEAEKPPPATVTVAPPASDVAVGVKLLAVRFRPSMVGSEGSPSPEPQLETRLMVCALEGGWRGVVSIDYDEQPEILPERGTWLEIGGPVRPRKGGR